MLLVAKRGERLVVLVKLLSNRLSSCAWQPGQAFCTLCADNMARYTTVDGSKIYKYKNGRIVKNVDKPTRVDLDLWQFAFQQSAEDGILELQKGSVAKARNS